MATKAVWDGEARYKMNGGLMSLFKKGAFKKKVCLKHLRTALPRSYRVC